MIEGIQGINLRPDELVLSGSSIVIDTETAVDADLVRRSIGVRGAAGTLRLRRKGTRIVWSPDDDVTPGWYRFQVDALISAEGQSISPGGSVTFGIVRSNARVPGRLAVENMARLRVGQRRVRSLELFDPSPRGKYVELMKATDRRSGAPVSLAFDQDGNRVDAEEMMANVFAARVRRFGKIHPRLDAHLRRADTGESIPVAIWVRTDELVGPGDKSPDRPVEAAQLDRQVERRMAVVHDATRGLMDELGRDARRATRDDVAPVVYASLTKTAIRRLGRSDRVAAVFAYDRRGFDDLDDSIAIASSDDAHALGSRGAGVRVAVWEQGPDDTSNLDIEDAFDPSGATSSHSRLVHAVIKNTQQNGPHGHAPDCLLYSANSYDLAALRWAVRDVRCTVINQSFHRTAEQTSDSLSFDDVYKDWLILHPPYPTILQAAGNGADTEYVNHKGFNSLTVANHNDQASALSGTSVFRNPTSDHADRELPEISANGTGVSAVGWSDSGTSFASPATAGVAAQLQGNDPILRMWPEGCRAILLAGATRNITDSTWWQDVAGGTDAADGSGALNALEAHRICDSRRSRNASATRRGWDVGVLDDDDFDNNRYSTFEYHVGIPPWLLGPTHVKVALTWNSRVNEFSIFGIDFPTSSHLDLDFDLRIYDSSGTPVAYSLSWDNSYEIAEFDGRRGHNYTIRIHRWSGTGWTWYGLAWTVTGGLLDVLELRRVAFEENFAR